MQESPYWNPRHETMPRDQIESLQVRKLKNLVAWAEDRVPWQARRLKAAGVSADSIKTLKDLQRIPMMTRDEWMQAQLEDPPFGPLLAAPQEAAIRYHLTSGTTGRIPLQVLDSMKDWEWIAEMWCYGFWGFGVRPADIVFFAFSYGTFVGFWGAHYACEKIGCLVLAGGNMTTDARVKQILTMKATVVCSTPTYALRMAQEAKTMGVDLAGSPVRRSAATRARSPRTGSAGWACRRGLVRAPAVRAARSASRTESPRSAIRFASRRRSSCSGTASTARA